MDVQALQASMDAWHDEFGRRFPGRITATGELRVWLLELLFMLDSVKSQEFASGSDGVSLFRFKQVAAALGINPRSTLRGALASSLVQPHVRFERFGTERPVPYITTGGLVALVAVISPHRFRSLERQRWHQRRRAVALEIIQALPADDPDVAAQIDRMVAPGLLH
jgi:hypothetical protein